MNLNSFSTNENKALLWSVLHGGGKFTGIHDSHVQNIKEIFEQVIHDVNEHYRKSNQPINLNAMNKEAVVVICKKIDSLRQSQQQSQQQLFNQNPQQTQLKKQQQIPQLETIYRAEDLQKERQSQFQNELNKKEKEMSSILKLKKPEEIKFTDDIYDKPIGNDMERLLAEALASREKELEQIKSVAFAPPPPSSSENSGIKENEKRVSFGSQLHVIENRQQQNESYYENENENENEHNDDVHGDISFIFNKLKKIKTQKSENEQQRQTEYQGNHVNENNNNNIHTTIIKMSQDIEYMKTALAELLEKVNKL